MIAGEDNLSPKVAGDNEMIGGDVEIDDEAVGKMLEPKNG